MRSFSKKLAFVLAAAMVVTGFAPAAQAKAADEMAINKSSQILYVNEGINHKGNEGVPAGKGNVSVYDFSVKNKPSNWKTAYSFAWSSSNEDVVTVKAGGVATAVGVGKATVYCKVTEKATKKVTTLKTAVEVKENAAKVAIKNADKYDGTTVEVNGVVDLDRVMYNAAGKSTTKKGTLVTDCTRWVAEPSKGVEINQSNGKFTFTEEAEAGDYTLYCETYQSSKYTKTTATSDKVVVTFVDKKVEVKQTTATKFVVNFGSATDVKLGDVAVDILIKGVDGIYKDACLVKNVKMADDKKSATVEMFYEFEDGVDYEITVKGYDTETMKASNGTPTRVILHANKDDVNDRHVLVGTDATIYFKLYDANGVEVESGWESANLEYHIKYANTDYETAGNTLFFNEAGDSAVVTVDYHTWEYDNVTGVEKGAFTSTPFTFVGVNKNAVYTKGISNYSVNGEEWRGADKNVVKMGDTTRWLQVKVLLTDGKERTIDMPDFDIYAKDDVTLIGTAKFTSLNEDVLGLYEGTRLTNDGRVPCISLDPRKEGVANVKVSYVINVNGIDVETTIATVAIQVKGEKSMNTVTPWTTSVTIATNPEALAEGITDKNFRDQTLGFTVKDQYGDDYGAYRINKITGTTNLSKVALERNAIINNGKTFTLDDSVFEDVLLEANATSKGGSFFFNIEVQDSVHYSTKTITFTVNARIIPEDATTTLFIDLNSGLVNSVGGNVARIQTNDGNNNNERKKSVTFTVYEMYNGAKVNEITLTGRKPVDTAGVVTGSYFYEVKRNGVPLTYNNNGVTAEQSIVKHGTAGNGNNITVDFNGIKNYVWYAGNPVEQVIADHIGDMRIATYNNYYDVVGGAGTYEFVLWQATENSKGELVFTRKLSKSIATTLNEGNYSFKFRNDVSVDVDNVNDRDELSKALLGCFTIADRNGNTYDKNSIAWNNIVDGKNVNIAGDTKKYFVNYKDVTATSVYVESIYFWEKVTVVDRDSDGNLIGGDIDTYQGDLYSYDVYAEYVVPLGFYVTVR